MHDTINIKSNLGTFAIYYFKLREEEKEISKLPDTDKLKKKKLKEIKKEILDCYCSLKKVIKRTINKEINRLGLYTVITEEQIESTKNDLLKEIVLSPENYEKYIDNILQDSNYAAEEQEELVKQAKMSKHVSSIIREISELEENPAAYIQSYLLKRILTLLKDNAEEKSKEYILLNNNIKKAIKILKEINAIYEPINKRYTVSKNPNAIFNPKTCSVSTDDELEKELKKPKHNLQEFILAFLRANYFYNFSAKDISTYAASMFLIEKENDLTAKKYNKNDDSDSYEIEAVSSNDTTAKAMAEYAMNSLQKAATAQKTDIQRELALLAYLYRTVPKYFTNVILTKEQLEEEETNCIKNFLNDKRFRIFNKSEVERTTASNRKMAGLRLLKSHLIDLPVEAQGIFIKLCCEYLEKKYIK